MRGEERQNPKFIIGKGKDGKKEMIYGGCATAEKKGKIQILAREKAKTGKRYLNIKWPCHKWLCHRCDRPQ